MRQQPSAVPSAWPIAGAIGHDDVGQAINPALVRVGGSAPAAE